MLPLSNPSILFLKSDPIPLETTPALYNPFQMKLLSFVYTPNQASLSEALLKIKDFSGIALNSCNSAIALRNIKEKVPFEYIKANIKVFVVGEKTARLVEKEFGWEIAIIGENYEDLKEKINESKGISKKILYLVGNLSDLKGLDCEYEEIQAYETKAIDYKDFEQQIEGILKEINGLPGILVYFSGSNARFFIDYLWLYEEKHGFSFKIAEKKHICFGEKTKEELLRCLKEKGVILDEKNLYIAKKSNFKEIITIIEGITLNK